MKNVNRDYLVKVNVKTAEIETPKDDMIFYVTDIWTSNIFFQLDFGKGNSLTDLHNENASDYDLTLRVVKPNKEHKEIKASLLSQDSNFFVADLKPDFTDYIGICECELFIETTINGRKETNTTDPFEYIVEGSVFSPLDEVIEGRPDYPPLADKLATKEYVDEAIANVDVSEIDLSAYAPKESPVFTGSISMGRKSGSTVGINSFAVGNSTTASGNCSYAEGDNAKAIGHGSHVEGSGTIASSNYQHVQGLFNIEDTENKYSHIIGNGTPYARRNIHTLDWSGNAWFAGKITAGSDPTENMDVATKEYVDAAISNLGGSSVDLSTYAPKESPVFTGSISLGRTGKVGNYSFAVGNNVEASGDYSHAEGNNTIASGLYSHAEGNGTLARGFSAHAEGDGCKVGSSSIFGADYAHAEGEYTLSSSKNQHVQGKFNIEDTKNKYAHIVGNGDSSNRSNAHTLDWNGNGWYSGNLYVGGTSQDNANKVLSTADIKFTSDGKLSVTINGVTKTFSPDA